MENTAGPLVDQPVRTFRGRITGSGNSAASLALYAAFACSFVKRLRIFETASWTAGEGRFVWPEMGASESCVTKATNADRYFTLRIQLWPLVTVKGLQCAAAD